MVNLVQDYQYLQISQRCNRKHYIKHRIKKDSSYVKASEKSVV